MISQAFEVDYGATRLLRFEPYNISGEERQQFHETIVRYVNRNIVMSTAAAMDDVKLCRLIERISIEICKEYAPSRNYGIRKAEIRSVILALINEHRPGEDVGSDGNG